MASSLSLDDYQELAARTELDPEASDPLIPLLGLTGEVGALTAEFKKQRRAGGEGYTGFDEAVVTELGDILWYLAALARRTGHGLGEIAERNLEKTAARWLPDDAKWPAFDDGFPPEQQLPKQFDVTFTTEGDRMQMHFDGEPLGDPIDDNSHVPDHYRFHDVFHLSYAAALGWSPILRALLRRKRKADPETDRVEDGARARAIEEAISALVFEMGASYNFFEEQLHVSDTILSAIEAMVRGLEVKDRTKAEWERAILTGFDVWRQLRERGSGVVRVDLEARSLELLAQGSTEAGRLL